MDKTPQDSGTDGFFAPLGEYLPSGFFTRTWFTPEQLQRAAPGSPTHDASWPVWSTIMHEWCHHLQVIGTTYGRYHYDLLMTEGACISKALHELFDKRPLDTLRRPLLKDLVNSTEIDSDPLILAASYRLVNRALFGDTMKTLPITPRGIALPVSKPCPRVRLNGKTYSIGSRHVLEGHAACNQRMQLLTSLSPSRFEKARAELDILDPYGLVEEVIRTKWGLNDEILTRLLCDIALNPDWPPESGEIKWEDFHPGWRIIRMVEAIRKGKSIQKMLPREADWDQLPAYEGFCQRILDHFGWKWPKDTLPATEESFPWFTARVVQVRTFFPLAFALIVEHEPTVADISSISSDRYTPETQEAKFDLDMNAATEFEARRNVAVIYEKTTYEILSKKTITCPFHNTLFPSDSGCPADCLFRGFFRAVFGITVDQFLTIPLRADRLRRSGKR